MKNKKVISAIFTMLGKALLFYKLFILWVVKEHCTVEMEHFQWVLQHRIVPFQLSFARWFREPLCHPISFIIKTLYCKVHFRRNHFFLLWNFSKALTKKLSYGFSIHVLLYFFFLFSVTSDSINFCKYYN